MEKSRIEIDKNKIKKKMIRKNAVKVIARTVVNKLLGRNKELPIPSFKCKNSKDTDCWRCQNPKCSYYKTLPWGNSCYDVIISQQEQDKLEKLENCYEASIVSEEQLEFATNIAHSALDKHWQRYRG